MALLDQQQLRTYEEQGYLLIPGLLSRDDLAPVEQTIVKAVDRVARGLYAEGRVGELFEDQPLSRRLVELHRMHPRESMSWNREVFSEAVYDLCVQPAVLDVAELLLGSGEITMNGDYWVRPKLPQEQLTTLPWHQDSDYYGAQTEPLHILSLWIPLVDVDERNGCMQFISGSHKWGLLPNKRQGDHLVPVEDVEARGRVETLAMKAGDAVAFRNLTFHRSLMNNSDGIRWSIDLRYSVTGTPLDWLAKMGLLGFVARSRHRPESVDSWQAWRAGRRAWEKEQA
ncbi:MAG: phytanoyl-CoA dioxygenase family protein [Caldilineaceae bacterium]|nr:phytanoyl-CoA dioxygenase family protein [Caldilineaceae bacterium]MCY4090515.1 phytanoyl-CoA dioxygenase family protein [Caldilineaceae bacterium]MDE0071394.1 phytanoyl-CoA dioxygenase family protein [Caldilineaceae bacterium]MDE0429812.1 phytanoyl-CoA dioxygenase family protein [Caldilineaceae bacterium]